MIVPLVGFLLKERKNVGKQTWPLCLCKVYLKGPPPALRIGSKITQRGWNEGCTAASVSHQMQSRWLERERIEIERATERLQTC